MRNNNAGLVFQLSEIVQQLRLRLIIKSGCSLVEKNDRSLGQQRSGDSYALHLTLAESSSPLGDERIESLRQLADEILRAGNTSGVHDIFFGRVGSYKSDVFSQSSREQEVALRNIRKELSHTFIDLVLIL